MIAPGFIARHPRVGAGLAASPDAQAETDAARRALPMQRLVGNGMDHDDAARLHELAAAGVTWPEAAEAIAEAKLALALDAHAHLQPISARTWFWQAAAAFRFAQSPLVRDDARKVALYQRSRDVFAHGAALANPPYEKLAIPVEGGTLYGWLMRPARVARPPAVILFGGADGWREEYHQAGLALLARGVAAVLLDGPGQGETRILGGLHLRTAVERSFGAAVQHLRGDARLSDRIGIWGNSLGGCFAARTASYDPDVAACCVVGGTWRPMEILERFPRFIDRIRAMTAEADASRASAILDAHTLDRHENRIACPLLVLHGGADRLFSALHAEELAAWAPSTDKRFIVWADGDHCVYNHTAEKHGLASDWFAARLRADDALDESRARLRDP